MTLDSILKSTLARNQSKLIKPKDLTSAYIIAQVYKVVPDHVYQKLSADELWQIYEKSSLKNRAKILREIKRRGKKEREILKERKRQRACNQPNRRNRKFFVTDEELAMAWSKFPSSMFRYCNVTVPKRILFSLSNQTIVKLCERYYRGLLNIQPKLTDADEVYLVSRCESPSPTIEDGIQRHKDIVLIESLLKHVKTRKKLPNRKVKIVDLLLSQVVQTPNGVEVLTESARRILEWWSLIKSVKLKAAWAYKLQEFYCDIKET